MKFLGIEVLLAPVGSLTPLIVKSFVFFLSLMKRSSTFSEATAKLILDFASRGSGIRIPSAQYIPSLASVPPFNSIQSPNL